MRPVDILDLEWPGSDRDRHIVTPVYLLLRRKYGLKVISGNIFNGYSLLLRHRPRLLMMASTIGAPQNHEIALFAKKEFGTRVVSLISEGNIPPHNCETMFWGWNKERVFFNDATILWTERTRNLILDRYPQLTDKLPVSGNTGFDRYKLLDFAKKKTFLKELGLERYGRVVGICGWGFDRLFGRYFETHGKDITAAIGVDQIELHRRDMIGLREIFDNLIKSMPETLFIIRYHPGCMDPRFTEFAGIDPKLPNVYFSGPQKVSKPAISDLISVSDAWVGYETTTAIESWLLGKPVIFVNPSGPDFLRPDNYRGVCVASDFGSLSKLLSELFETGRIAEYESKETQRNRILGDTIGFWDGRCHERAAEIIFRILTDGAPVLAPAPGRPAWGGIAARILGQVFSNLRHFIRTGKTNRLLPDSKTIANYENLYASVGTCWPQP